MARNEPQINPTVDSCFSFPQHLEVVFLIVLVDRNVPIDVDARSESTLATEQNKSSK